MNHPRPPWTDPTVLSGARPPSEDSGENRAFAPSSGMGATLVEPTGFEANRADALAVGSRLDIYEIERVLGASGFGFVYLAQDPVTRQRVAIKEYLPDTLAVRDEDGMQVLLRAASHADAFERGRLAFVEESQLLARCEHPSLVRVLRSWQAKGTAYRAMPYYPGNSLFSLREAMDAPPDEASLRALLDGLMGALETLHKAGAVHREVSPWNILLLPDDTPILLDFNAARRAMMGDRARALMSLLSPTFAPPELMDPSAEKPVGPWTDVHALAQVMVYCLSGQMPRSASSAAQREPMAALVRRMQARFPTLHLSDSFMRAIDTALSPDPAHRPKVMAELRQRLDDHPAPLVVGIREDEPAGAQAASEGSGPQESLGKDVPLSNEASAPDAGDGPMADLFRAVAARADATPSRAEEPFYSVLSASGQQPPANPPLGPSSKPVVPSRSPSSFAMYPDERLPMFDLAHRSRRKRRLRVAAMTLLAMCASSAAAWWLLQERSATELKSAFEQAVSREVAGKSAAVKTSPAPASAPVAVPAEEPAAAASAAPIAMASPPSATASAPAVPTPSIDSHAAHSPATNEPSNASNHPPPENTAIPSPSPAAALSSGTGVQAPAAAAAPASIDQGTEPPAQDRTVSTSPKLRITNPREACGTRTDFSLYRCMQHQCAQAQWKQHAACKRLRETDEVS